MWLASARSRNIFAAGAITALFAGGLAAIDARQAPPPFAELVAANVVLSAPIRLHTGHKHGPYASVIVAGDERRIENTGLLWHNTLPAPVAALKAGDKLRIWMSGYHIWQLDAAGTTLLSYPQSVAAFHELHARGWVMFECFIGLGCAIMLLALLLL